MAEMLEWSAYKAQTEVVHAEKVKLQQLNALLREARKTCSHTFVEGACSRCGQNEEAWKALGGEAVTQQGPSYKFVD